MNIRRQLADFRNSNDSDKIDTVIGSSVVIDGNISSRKAVRIDGTVHGNLHTRGNIFTGPESVINGDVSGKNITVCGVVNGDVKARGRVILTEKARISGDLSMEHMVVDEGALVNGTISMLKGSAETGTDTPDEAQK